MIPSVERLPAIVKRVAVMLSDALMCFFSVNVAFFLRLDEWVSVFNDPRWRPIWPIVVSVILALPMLEFTGAYRWIVRHSGLPAFWAVTKPLALYACLYAGIFTLLGVSGVPRTIGIIQPVLLLVFILVTRSFASYLLRRKIGTKEQNNGFSALIYGTGDAGRQLALSMGESGIKIVGFLDDNSRLCGRIIHGINIYSPAELPSLVESFQVSMVFLAMPSISRAKRNEIVQMLESHNLAVRTLPTFSDLAYGRITVSDLKVIEVEDLLGRDPVVPSRELMGRNILGKVVLVTGAGGSIGSELCRQIITQDPAKLILFELSEFALYAIEKELVQYQLQTSLVIVPVLGSVLDANKLKNLCWTHGVHTVFHAAAYKHVPMVEVNPAAGVWNNVFGTLRLVDAVCAANVETFVLISTDKAVRPTNVMGCSKRLAEMILQAKHMHYEQLGLESPKLCMVRFGNVLGSSGSVVPVFREQIKKGGPLTVTHPEIIRYFMTIPEAAQLVIQAGAMGEGGDVMVLDMGVPVKIVELAKRMIYLSGLTVRSTELPQGDIEIQFTGLRPGEKLYEELLIGENVLPTPHPRIMRASEKFVGWSELEALLEALEEAVKSEDSQGISMLLKRAVPEFSPNAYN